MCPHYPLTAAAVCEYRPQLGFVKTTSAAGRCLTRYRFVGNIKVVSLVAVIRRHIQLRGTYITAEIRIAAGNASRGCEKGCKRLRAADGLRGSQRNITCQQVFQILFRTNIRLLFQQREPTGIEVADCRQGNRLDIAVQVVSKDRIEWKV